MVLQLREDLQTLNFVLTNLCFNKWYSTIHINANGAVHHTLSDGTDNLTVDICIFSEFYLNKKLYKASSEAGNSFLLKVTANKVLGHFSQVQLTKMPGVLEKGQGSTS